MTTLQPVHDIVALMELAPVIPVLVIEDVAHALPVAQALVSGGLRALEVTLRTPCAIEVIHEMQQVEGAVVGAGTVTGTADLDAALAAGSQFIVSPGLTSPPGRLQHPAKGARPRRTRSTLPLRHSATLTPSNGRSG